MSHGPDLDALLDADPEARDRDWQRVLSWLSARFGGVRSLEAVLFIVGLRARGWGFEPQLTREQKEDLIMEGTRVALAEIGLLKTPGGGGAAMSESIAEDMEGLTAVQRETLIRIGIIRNLYCFVREE